jgi:hypothetical protein
MKDEQHPIMFAEYVEHNWLDLWEWQGFGEYTGVHPSYGGYPKKEDLKEVI